MLRVLDESPLSNLAWIDSRLVSCHLLRSTDFFRVPGQTEVPLRFCPISGSLRPSCPSLCLLPLSFHPSPPCRWLSSFLSVSASAASRHLFHISHGVYSPGRPSLSPRPFP